MKSCVIYDTTMKTTLNQLGVAKFAPVCVTKKSAKSELSKLVEQLKLLKNHPKMQHYSHVSRVEARWLVDVNTTNDVIKLLSFDVGAVTINRVEAATGVEMLSYVLPYDDYISNIEKYVGNACDSGCGIVGANQAPATERDRAKLADVLQAFGRCKNVRQYTFMDSLVTWDTTLQHVDGDTIVAAPKNQRCIDVTQWRSNVSSTNVDALMSRGLFAGFDRYIDDGATLSSLQNNELKFHRKLMKVLLRVTRPSNSRKVQARNKLGQPLVSANTFALLCEAVYRRFGVNWHDYCRVWQYEQLEESDWIKLKTSLGRRNDRAFRLLFTRRGPHVDFHSVLSQ